VSDDNTDKRFSLVYLTTDKGLPDSERARIRFKSLLDLSTVSITELVAKIKHELGVEVPHGFEGFLIGRFVERCELRDFLDLISLIVSLIPSANLRMLWLRECRRIFSEEHLRYTINDAGGVRFSADVQFEQSVQATLANLGRPELSGARLATEHCLQALSKTPPDGKAAVRNIFEAVEIGFKTLCSGPARIGDAEIQRNLVPLLQLRYQADETAKNVALRRLA
jgi:hypothetical protein